MDMIILRLFQPICGQGVLLWGSLIWLIHDTKAPDYWPSIVFFGVVQSSDWNTRCANRQTVFPLSKLFVAVGNFLCFDAHLVYISQSSLTDHQRSRVLSTVLPQGLNLMNIDFPLFLWVTSGKIVHRYPVTTSVTKVLKQSASDTMAEQLVYKASCSRSNRATTDLVCLPYGCNHFKGCLL